MKENALNGPNAAMWKSWYMFRLKDLDLKIEGLVRQKKTIEFELEQLHATFKLCTERMKKKK